MNMNKKLKKYRLIFKNNLKIRVVSITIKVKKITIVEIFL